MASDMSDVEHRAVELARVTAMFFRKCLDEQMTPFTAADLAKTYLQTLMLQDGAKPPPPPWERPE
jgi:hypothetical protein